MPKIFSHVIHESNDPMTGSGIMAPVASPVQHIVSGAAGTVISTGSWYYFSNTWGVDSSTTGSLDHIASGSWGGVDNSWGVTTLPTESYDRFSPVSDTNPSPGQSIGTGEWDPFPLPPPEPEERLAQRDTTRYRKAYSSQRLQPRRVRLIKRQG